MKRAIDYAYGWTPQATARFKAHGVEVVLRYVGIPTAGKCIGKTELAALHAAGLGLGFIYESTAQWMLGGREAGANAAYRSRSYIRERGGPREPFVWLAADWDVQPSQVGAVLDCLHGAVSVLGPGHVGIYGGLRVCTAALDRRAVAKAWQTVAWSHGQWERRAVLRQVLGQQWGDLGLSYDTDQMVADNVGQWPAPEPPHPDRVLVDVPRGVYRWHVLWVAFWPIRGRLRRQASDPVSQYRVRLSVPWRAWETRAWWNEGWQRRAVWREVASRP